MRRIFRLIAAVEVGIATPTAQIAQLSIAGRIDGLYLGNDNTVFSALSGIAEVALEKKIPAVTADPSSA